VVDFYKIIVPFLKIKQTKVKILLKTVRFNKKTQCLRLKINRKSNHFKKDKIQNKIKNSLVTKIIKSNLISK